MAGDPDRSPVRQNGGAAMVRTRYAPDRGLQARMGLTMFLLGIVFVAFVTALVFILAAFKVGAGAIIFFAVLFGGGGGGRGGNNNNNNGGALPILLIVMLVSVVVYAISFLLIRLLSRYRELAADRAGALLTGQPSALASALTKVSGAMSAIPTRDLRQAQALNAFYFAPALKADTVSLSTVFSTHPSLERRLQQLSEISSQLGR